MWPGSPFPLGATWDGAGVNFALFSEHATKVELCLFDSADARWSGSASRWRSAPIASGMGTCRTCGPDSSTDIACTARGSPQQGHRFNPAKVLLDPYARAIGRPPTWHPSLFAYRPEPRRRPADTADSAPYAPLAVVTESAFMGSGPRSHVPWHHTVIYELHVKGFTALNARIPAELRGTYLGLASAPVMII